MNHEDSHIIATCAKCDFRFDILFGVFCPRCRERAVRLAFSPVDPQRTALGMGIDAQAWEQSKEMKNSLDAAMQGIEGLINSDGSEKDNNYYWHGKENPGRTPERWGSMTYARCTTDAEPLPEGMKMPVSTVDQIYELKRMRRLIGKL